ncbi:hypothetical protein EVA_07263 [gut metagenome]|uniref:Uncharacterized protein n=1 Tax=gut metagenome TaxID=749906 RepID=J9CWL1_9ZZZZ
MYTFVYTCKKKLQKPHYPQPPSRGGFVFVFPLVFPHLFPKESKQSQTYELVSILTSTIYVLSSRARIMREKQPISTSFGILKYEIKNKNHNP